MEQAHRYHPALFWLALLTSVIAFVLIGSGGTVTSTGAGMIDQTWSFSFLYLLTSQFFEVQKESIAKFIEHSHRLLGFIVGVLAIFLAALCYCYEKDRRRWIGAAVLLAVGLQGALGAARILLNSKQGVVSNLLGRDYAMIHGFFGQVTFAFLVGCTLSFSRSWVTRRQDRSPFTEEFQANSKLLTILFLVQLTIAVLVRHYGGGLLIIAHASVAGLILLFVSMVVWRSRRLDSVLVQRPVWALGVEVLMMIALGTAAWWFGAGYGALEDNTPDTRRMTLATLHQWLGALTLATSLIVTLRAHRHLISETTTAPTATGAV
jgi:heme A synthase